MTLPPGRARLATRPVPTGSPAAAKTIGMAEVACLAARVGGVAVRDDDINLEADELGRDLGGALVASLRPAIFDCDCPSLGPAEFVQSLHKSGGPLALASVAPPKNPMVGNLPGCCARAASGHAAAAPPSSVMNSRRLHSITSSARASSDGGTSRPSDLAVLRLITSSYLVGACTGRSAGFSPLRMRST